MQNKDVIAMAIAVGIILLILFFYLAPVRAEGPDDYVTLERECLELAERIDRCVKVLVRYWRANEETSTVMRKEVIEAQLRELERLSAGLRQKMSVMDRERMERLLLQFGLLRRNNSGGDMSEGLAEATGG